MLSHHHPILLWRMQIIITRPRHVNWYPLGGSSNTSNPVVSLGLSLPWRSIKDLERQQKMPAAMTKVPFVCYTPYFWKQPFWYWEASLNSIKQLFNCRERALNSYLQTEQQRLILQTWKQFNKEQVNNTKLEQEIHSSDRSLPERNKNVQHLCLILEEVLTEVLCGPLCCSPLSFPHWLLTINTHPQTIIYFHPK